MRKKIDKKEYFDGFAHKWCDYRRRRAYYWNSITDYCRYFIHPTDSVLEVGCGAGDLVASVAAPATWASTSAPRSSGRHGSASRTSSSG